MADSLRPRRSSRIASGRSVFARSSGAAVTYSGTESRRPDRKTRGERMPGAFDRRATQRGGGSDVGGLRVFPAARQQDDHRTASSGEIHAIPWPHVDPQLGHSLANPVRRRLGCPLPGVRYAPGSAIARSAQSDATRPSLLTVALWLHYVKCADQTGRCRKRLGGDPTGSDRGAQPGGGDPCQPRLGVSGRGNLDIHLKSAAEALGEPVRLVTRVGPPPTMTSPVSPPSTTAPRALGPASIRPAGTSRRSPPRP